MDSDKLHDILDSLIGIKTAGVITLDKELTIDDN